jgi:hypothetical protein
MTVVSVDTGSVICAAPLLNDLLQTNFSAADPSQILLFTPISAGAPPPVRSP